MQDAGEVCVFSVSVGSEKHILTSQAEWVKTDPTYRLQSPEEEAITRVDSSIVAGKNQEPLIRIKFHGSAQS